MKAIIWLTKFFTSIGVFRLIWKIIEYLGEDEPPLIKPEGWRLIRNGNARKAAEMIKRWQLTGEFDFEEYKKLFE